mgnify:CR=1 FL=1
MRSKCHLSYGLRKVYLGDGYGTENLRKVSRPTFPSTFCTSPHFPSGASEKFLYPPSHSFSSNATKVPSRDSSPLHLPEAQVRSLPVKVYYLFLLIRTSMLKEELELCTPRITLLVKELHNRTAGAVVKHSSVMYIHSLANLLLWVCNKKGLENLRCP